MNYGHMRRAWFVKMAVMGTMPTSNKMSQYAVFGKGSMTQVRLFL